VYFNLGRSMKKKRRNSWPMTRKMKADSLANTQEGIDDDDKLL